MQNFTHDGQSMKYSEIGDKNAETAVIWAHGWGTNHTHFSSLIEPLTNMAHHYAVDFPGFGESPPPKNPWSPEDYANLLESFIKTIPQKKLIWICHSFGGRVGTRLAAKHPGMFAHMVYIGAHGIKPQRSIFKYLWLKTKVYTFKGLKKLIPFGIVSEDWLKQKFGSADYRNAGSAMRGTMIKTVNDHLDHLAPNIKCPVTLVYGSKDDQTPVSMGKKYEQLIPNANLVVLDGYDHYTILTTGRHQLATLIKPILHNQ